MQLQFWFEFGSTYSYPAAMRIAGLAQSAGVSLEWRPFLLGPIFRERGLPDSPFNLDPARGRYMWRDLERICGSAGIPWRRPSAFPRNGLMAARVACWFQREPWLPGFTRAVYLANFAEDRDISDPAVIRSILESLGLQPALADVARLPQVKDRLRCQTAEAHDLGIFGAPTFHVAGEFFWGNDRLEAALDWAASRS